jgi:hypothetical protein
MKFRPDDFDSPKIFRRFRVKKWGVPRDAASEDDRDSLSPCEQTMREIRIYAHSLRISRRA